MEPPISPLKSPVKPFLITPSASPPPLRTDIRYSRAISESVPAPKRQRTASTPRSTTQGTPGPSSSLSDIHQERRASTMRLLDFWDSLASYTRALDEDDIVDVMTGKITRDNGVLRNSKNFTFGSLDTPPADSIPSDEGSDVEDNEYDQDELDSFADDYTPTADVLSVGGLRLDARGKIMPPVTPLDPADANDLREFMEAERRRKELCGTDVEEGEEDEEVNTDYEGADAGENHGKFDRKGPDTTREEDEVEEGYGHYSDNVSSISAISDDELDDWTVDDSNIVYPIVKADVENVPNEVESMGETPPFQRVDPGKGIICAASSQSLAHPKQTPQQLYTPPQSSSSAGPSYTQTETVNNIIDLSADATPSPPAKAISRPSLGHSPKKKSQAPINRNEFEGRIGGTVSHLSDVTPTRASSRLVREEEGSVSSSIGQTHKHTAFVLLTPRKSSSSQKRPLVRTEDVPANKKGKSKDGMKESLQAAKPCEDAPVTKEFLKTTLRKFHSASNCSREDLHDRTIVSQSSPTKPSQAHQTGNKDDLRTTPDPDESQSHSTPDATFFLSPTLPSPPIPRKRKRILSESEAEFAGPRSPVAEVPRRLWKVPNKRSSLSLSPKDDVKRGKSTKRSPLQRQRRTPGSESDSGSSVSNASEKYRSRSHGYSHAHSRYSYPQVQPPFPPPSHTPTGYVPIQDPRAHLIITQAMQQLSALVSSPWIPPYSENSVPQTPSRYHYSRPFERTFATPTHHHHPYPYTYDPNLSRATLPPDSPDVSSPEKSNTSRRKSLVRRSRSRGRRVSFHVHDDHDYDEKDNNSSPERHSNARDHIDQSGYDGSPRSYKGKDRARTPYATSRERDADLDGLEYRRERSAMYARGQTPGPSFSSLSSLLSTDPSAPDRPKKHHSSQQRKRGR